MGSTSISKKNFFSAYFTALSNKKKFEYQQDIADTSCLCEVCENTPMMAKAIWKQKSGHPPNAHDKTEKYSRDSNNPKCTKKTSVSPATLS